MKGFTIRIIPFLLMLSCGASCMTAGDEVAFMRGGALRVVALDDLSERVVTELPKYERPITWSPDGRHLLFWKHSAIGWDIWRVDADGGNPVNLTNVESGGCRSAVYSPDGARIAFLRDQPQGVYIMNADGSASRRLTANGHRDEPPAFSPDGTRLVYMALARIGERRVRTDLHVIDVVAADGELQNPPAICAGSSASWSRDGRSILLSGRREGNREILLIAPDGANQRNLTRSREDDDHPVWSPDGTRIAYFTGTGESTHELRLMNADGSGVQTLATIEGLTWPVTWSPGGRRVAYAGGSREARSLFVVDVAAGKSRRLAQGGVGFPVWRPRPATRRAGSGRHADPEPRKLHHPKRGSC